MTEQLPIDAPQAHLDISNLGRSAEATDHAWSRRLLPIATLVLIVAGWEFMARFYAHRSVGGAVLVPRLEQIADAAPQLANYWKGGFGVKAVALGGDRTWEGAALGLFYNSWLTGVRLAAGLGLGVAVGILGAIAISWSRLTRSLFSLPSHFTRMMPLLGMVPLFQLWFAGTDRGAYYFVAYAVGVIMFAITLNAIGNVPTYYLQYARSLGSRGARTYFSIVLPAIVPQLRAAILLSLGFAWNAVIAAELIGQQYGLGVIVHSANQFSNTPLLALIAVIILVYAGLSYFLLNCLLGWITRWAE
jgi:sulfonate transport system permease protein